MLGFGLFGRIWVRIGAKGDKTLRMGQGGWMYGRTAICTDGRMDRQTDGWMDGWMDRQTDGRRDGPTNQPSDGQSLL